MSQTLRRKLEAAITGYLETNASTIGLTAGAIVPGTTTEEPTGDYLVVSVSRLSAHPDIPQAMMGQVILHFKSSATKDGSERTAVDTIVEKTHTFVMKPTADTDNDTWDDSNREASVLLAALNKPLSGGDTRTVTPLHIYYLGPADEVGDVESEGWADQLVYDIIAQPMNSH